MTKRIGIKQRKDYDDIKTKTNTTTKKCVK